MPAVSHEVGLLRRGHEVRGLPRRYPPQAVWRALRRVPHGGGLARRGGRHPCASESLSAARRALYGGVRFLSQGRRRRAVYRPEHGVCLLPLEELPAGEPGQPSGRRFPARLPPMPRIGRLALTEIRPHPIHPFPDRWRARRPGMQRLPCRRTLCRRHRGLFRVPRPGLRLRGERRPRQGGLPQGLHELPQYGRLEGRAIRPRRSDEVPVDWRPRPRGVHVLPCQREICRDSRGLLRMPRGELRKRQEPRSRQE